MDLVARIGLVPLQALDRIQLLQVLTIRNEPGVRRMMYTDHVISEDEHFSFIANLPGDHANRAYAITLDGAVVGGANLKGIDRTAGCSSWGIYLRADQRGKGIGKAAEFAFLDLAFGSEGLSRLDGEVLSYNASTMALHSQFGQVSGAILEGQFFREGQWVDVHLFSVTAAQWRVARKALVAAHQAGC